MPSKRQKETLLRNEIVRVVTAPAVKHSCETFEEACARCGMDALGREDRIINEDGRYKVVNFAYWEVWYNAHH